MVEVSGRQMKYLGNIFLLFIVCTLFSCTKTVYVEDPLEEDKRPIVYFVSKQGSLGDIGYVDSIYRGVVRAADEGGMMLSIADLPSDEGKIEEALAYMLEYMGGEGQERRALVVMVNDNLEPLLHKCEDAIKAASNVDFLLTETSDTTLPVHSIRLPQYGVYYQAGRLAGKWIENISGALVVAANTVEPNLEDMCGGFSCGLKASAPDAAVREIFLSETSGGYDMADYAYRLAYGIGSQYDVVLPLCGGSAQGFYRYNREYPDKFYTIGVDCDMQRYSPSLPFSVVKHIDRAVRKWITDWSKGTLMPSHLWLGLASGYTEIVVADTYLDGGLSDMADSLYDEAVEKEEEYESR